MQTLPPVTRPTPARTRERIGYPAGGIGFDWIAVVPALMITLGAYLDAWAHNHGRVDQSFFTPWHAILYGAFGLGATLFVGTAGRNIGRGYSWRRMLPEGYGLAIAGVGSFVLGGIGDMIWHALFGIEVDVAALISPLHLTLGIGLLLLESGPLRAAWRRLPAGAAHGWSALGPPILTVALITALLNGLTMFAHPLADTFAAPGPALTTLAAANATVKVSGTQTLESMAQSLGIASIMIQAALQMGFILALVRRWRLPFGALTLIVALPGALLCAQHDHYPTACRAGLSPARTGRCASTCSGWPCRRYTTASTLLRWA
jgi:hypothetical protein